MCCAEWSGPEFKTVEADMMAAHLRHKHEIERVLLERASTNCGNNVTLARDLTFHHGLRPRTVALVQDPTMQRRMDAVFPVGVAGSDASQSSCA